MNKASQTGKVIYVFVSYLEDMLAGLLALTLVLDQEPLPYFQAPAGKDFAKVVPGGLTILPNGRYVTPKGARLYTQEDLWSVAQSPDGKILVGTDDGGLTIYSTDNLAKPLRKIAKRPSFAPTAVFTKDGSKLYVSGGDSSTVEIYSTSTWESLGSINVRSGDKAAPYLNSIVLSQDERFLYGVDVAHQDLVTIDLSTSQVLGRVKAGRQPYAITLSPDGKRLFVANIGIFDYKLVGKPRPGEGNPRGLNQPAFKFPSKESEKGVEREGRSVPGLGSPYVPDAHSVWSYEIASGANPKLQHQVKTGIMIHAPADGGKSVGGSAPCALLAHGNSLFVANSNNDTVQVFDSVSLKLKRTIKIAPVPALARLRGVIPSGMTINRAGTRLFVAESGLNAVAIIDPTRGTVLGHIPTGWFPMSLELSPDEKSLVIATQKGIGRGPSGAEHPRLASDERFGLPAMPGMIDYVKLPDATQLAKWSNEVLSNNGLLVARTPAAPKVFPVVPGKPSDKIKYVVFITKENHTFDGIFGGLKGAQGWPAYAEFGREGWISEKGKAERVPIMPNHIRLAEQFSISDNFYMEPQASGDGHRWLVGVYPSLWTTRVFYAGWNFRADNNTPGRLISFGSDGSQIPEDYLENGSMFEHLNRHKVTMRNYGEGYELPRTDEGEETSKSGTFYPFNHPMPKVLHENTCFDFPAYNTNIPDIARADWFFEDLQKNYISKKKPLPRFLNIAICNDHGAGPRPKEGYPYVASYMADNDLALGRMVDWLSHRPEWKNMAIFVTQDDSGGDADHIDRHRSFVLAISPWVKRGYVSRDHTSIMSIIRSIYLLFGIGPNNMFDALATPLHDMFTDTPDFTPYKFVESDPRVFKPADTFDPSDPQFKRRRAEGNAPRMDDPDFVEWLRGRANAGGG
ncbi:MAG: bifunctional YncE family protein/alkaline phosphatase family protein [Fimbriimonas sp.]